jgi:SAM-dependent methyltransferase
MWQPIVSLKRAEYLWNLYRSYSRQNQRALTGRYLDIGVGDLVNAIVFSQRAGSQSAVGIDISSDLTKSRSIALVRADARAPPFRDRSFELITMISLIEHVQEHLVCLSEALRVLRADGELFMQFPNRYFPIELHSGLCMHFYLPERLRDCVANATGRGEVKEIDVPTPGKIGRILRRLEPVREVVTVGFSYPESLLSELLPGSGSIGVLAKVLSRILERMNILRILPIGYIVLVAASSPKIEAPMSEMAANETRDHNLDRLKLRMRRSRLFGSGI